MWQRKQTIFLAVTCICLVLSIFFPIWSSVDANVERMLFSIHYTIKSGEVRNPIYFPYSIVAILAIAAATVSIIEVGKFENRLLQLKLAALNSLLMAATIGTSVWFALQLIKSNQIGGSFGLGLWLPFVAMVSNMIANRFIRKDEKLVRDSDRLR